MEPETFFLIVTVIKITVCFCLTFLQEGFILGESKIEEQVTINDSQADHIHIEEIYSELDLDTPRIRSLDKASFFLKQMYRSTFPAMN